MCGGKESRWKSVLSGQIECLYSSGCMSAAELEQDKALGRGFQRVGSGPSQAKIGGLWPE